MTLPVEPVSNAPDADQESRFLRILLQFIAEVADIGIDPPVRQDGIAAPALLHQLVDRQDPAAVFQEDLEELEFHGGQVDLLAPSRDFAPAGVDGDGAETINSARPRTVLDAAQQGPGPGGGRAPA